MLALLDEAKAHTIIMFLWYSKVFKFMVGNYL